MMNLERWGLSDAEVCALTPTELADYDRADAEYRGAIATTGSPGIVLPGDSGPVSADRIRAIADVIQTLACDLTLPLTRPAEPLRPEPSRQSWWNRVRGAVSSVAAPGRARVSP